MNCRFISQLLPLTKLTRKLILAAIFSLTFVSFNVAADELKEITTLTEQGQQAAALERINAYLVTNPKDASGIFLKGIILVESGKRDDAIKTFTDLTEKYPNLPEPYNNLAVLYADAGQYDKAKKALETAIKTHPSYATAHENLGDIYARMASEAYDKALQLDNGNARAQNKLAMIKDLFGPSVGSKPIATAKATPAAKVDVAKVEPVKPNKAGILPIRPADKKPEPAKVEVEKPVVDTTADEEKNVLEAVNGWAKAWSAKDADKYLANYADTFKPAKGESRKAWEQTRRERVSRPASINVEVGTPKVTINGSDSAKVSFTQTYQADGKPIRTAKTLVMKKTNGAWLIDQEIASN